MSAKLFSLIRKVWSILQEDGLSGLPRRTLAKVQRLGRSLMEEAKARRRGSFSLSQEPTSIVLIPRLSSQVMKQLSLDACIPQAVSTHYLNHQFDLLGSGWTKVYYGMRCRGLDGYRYDMSISLIIDQAGQWLVSRLNPSNLYIARHIWQYVDTGYNPIDWQLDFKSGYRWSENIWAVRLPYGVHKGVDVKVPWELSRMQHLPQMALRAVALGTENEEAILLAREVRNECMDFMSTNPPGFGVNWLCPMDIAIRAANWCITWDILQSGGFPFDQNYVNILAHGLLDHGRYIVGHLEWSENRGNHYLANICGLIYIAAYLPETEETDKWLAFGIDQLQLEMLHQFLPDGGNFEGSTAYHRLSTEMVLYATAIVLGLPLIRLNKLQAIDAKKYRFIPKLSTLSNWKLQDTGKTASGEIIYTPFTRDFVERLQLAVHFMASISKPDGTFPQIGDNDSGRFFKLSPKYSVSTMAIAMQKYLNLDSYDELNDTDIYFFEESTNSRHVQEAASAMGFGQEYEETNNFSHFIQHTCDYLAVFALATAHSFSFSMSFLKPFKINLDTKAGANILVKRSNFLKQDTGSKKLKLEYKRPVLNSIDEFTANAFEHFGCFVLKYPDLYLIVRCVVKSNHSVSGHHHDDQLSIELEINGKPVIRDPGSFNYTALPDQYAAYRDRKSHIPYKYSFCLESLTHRGRRYYQPAIVKYIGNNGFHASIQNTRGEVELLINIDLASISVMYSGTEFPKYLNVTQEQNVHFSPGYGIKIGKIT